jgi:hypothetical protein
VKIKCEKCALSSTTWEQRVSCLFLPGEQLQKALEGWHSEPSPRKKNSWSCLEKEKEVGKNLCLCVCTRGWMCERPLSVLKAVNTLVKQKNRMEELCSQASCQGQSDGVIHEEWWTTLERRGYSLKLGGVILPQVKWLLAKEKHKKLTCWWGCVEKETLIHC